MTINVPTEVPELAGVRKAAHEIQVGDWVAIGPRIVRVGKTLPAKRGVMTYLQIASAPPDFYGLLPGERVLVVNLEPGKVTTEARVLWKGSVVATRTGMTAAHSIGLAREYVEDMLEWSRPVDRSLRAEDYKIQTRRVVTTTQAGEWHDA